jgi:TonB-dependent receptor
VRLRSAATIVRVLLAAGALATPCRAQTGGGEAARADGATQARDSDASAPGHGTLLGQVFDGATGLPLEGAKVVVTWPAPADGGQARQEVRETGATGGFQFPSLPPGRYSLRFSKPGHRSSSLVDVEVRPDELARADFSLPRLAGEATPGEAPDIEEFVVLGSEVAVDARELRLDSDELLNVLSAEELSNFAASDIAEGIKRLAGVNVVEGQFAVIRGLEDRYSSTLYNGAPVPSPDPDRQSVQLDLFPSEVVSDLVVAKTFGPALPSNSSGGSIDIRTHEYPPELELQVSGGVGLNSNAWENFVDYQDGSPVGVDADGSDTTEGEGGTYFGGRHELANREVRFKALYNWELDYSTGDGFQENLEPKRAWLPGTPPPPFVTTPQSGDLSLGELNLSGGRFDLTTSERSEQETRYGGLGFDLDEEGAHRVDGSIFYTHKDEQVVQLKENGYLPNFDYAALAEREGGSGEINARTDFLDASTLGAFVGRGGVRDTREDFPSRGALWFTNFSESQSFQNERDLSVYQLNGDHRFDALEGLHLAWAANHADTTQDETSYGAQLFFEPDDRSQPAPASFPVPAAALGPGRYAANSKILFSSNDVDEQQDFARLDADYETELFGALVTVSTGGWWERADRDVASSFLETPTINGAQCSADPRCLGSGTQFAILGETPQDVGQSVYDFLIRAPDGSLGQRQTSNESSREIQAWHLGLKGSVLEERLDLLGGLRLEEITIESNNDPFIGEDRFGAPEIFPTRYLFFDRLDNPFRAIPEVSEAQVQQVLGRGEETFNDQILGVDVPQDVACPVAGQPGRRCVDLVDQAQVESLVNGKIDETELLPSLGFTYRPVPGLDLRGAWSQTVARPSFREMGYYVSVDPGTDDLVVGNPQLGLSDVESFDGRVEYTWGGLGDLFALSLFQKKIQDPIESIVVRNPLNTDVASSAVFRTYFNNPNEASLWGLELEARKAFDFLPWEVAEYLSVGGNYTWIDAEVDRTEAELLRSEAFFGVLPGDVQRFSRLEKSRRLFGQPEWIANADFTFDHPDWGTKATLAFFAISDVLDAAGVANAGPDGQILAYTVDRYVDEFWQLDLILSQTLHLDRLPGGLSLPGDLTFKLSGKNLTNTTRALVYDTEQTGEEFEERSYRVGRDFKLSLTWSLAF